MNKKLFLFIISILLVAMWFIFVNAGFTITDGGIDIKAPQNDTRIFVTQNFNVGGALLGNATYTGLNATTNVTWFAQNGSGTNTTILILRTANITNGTVNYSGVGWLNVTQGRYNITLRATNETDNPNFFFGGLIAAPNATTVGYNVFFIRELDTNGVVINNPGSGANLSGTVNFRGNFSGSLNVTTNVTWYLMNSSGANSTLGGNNGLNNLNITNDTLFITEGNYTVWMIANNNSAFSTNNITKSITRVIIDHTKPTLTVELSDSDDKIITRGEIKVTCTADDGPNSDLVSKVDASLNKVKITKPNGDTTTYSGVSEQTFKDLDTAQTGTYTVECLATDYASNEGSKTKEFQVNARTSSTGVTTTEGGVRVNYDLSVRDTTSASGREGSVKSFTLDGTTKHEIEFKTVTSTSVTIIIRSEPQELTLNIGESKEVDLNSDGKNDVKVTLVNIVSGRASLAVDKLAGAAMIGPEPREEEEETTGTTDGRTTGRETEGVGAGGGATAVIVVVIIVVLVVLGYFLFGKKKGGKKGEIKFSKAELKKL